MQQRNSDFDHLCVCMATSRRTSRHGPAMRYIRNYRPDACSNVLVYEPARIKYDNYSCDGPVQGAQAIYIMAVPLYLPVDEVCHVARFMTIAAMNIVFSLYREAD
jgi:hypothetical protein